MKVRFFIFNKIVSVILSVALLNSCSGYRHVEISDYKNMAMDSLTICVNCNGIFKNISTESLTVYVNCNGIFKMDGLEKKSDAFTGTLRRETDIFKSDGKNKMIIYAEKIKTLGIYPPDSFLVSISFDNITKVTFSEFNQDTKSKRTKTLILGAIAVGVVLMTIFLQKKIKENPLNIM